MVGKKTTVAKKDTAAKKDTVAKKDTAAKKDALPKKGTVAKTVNNIDVSTQIGETAGQVWHALDASGPSSITKLTKGLDAPRDLVLQAIGWLAREDKIAFNDTGRGRMVSLK